MPSDCAGHHFHAAAAQRFSTSRQGPPPPPPPLWTHCVATTTLAWHPLDVSDCKHLQSDLHYGHASESRMLLPCSICEIRRDYCALKVIGRSSPSAGAVARNRMDGVQRPIAGRGAEHRTEHCAALVWGCTEARFLLGDRDEGAPRPTQPTLCPPITFSMAGESQL